MDPWRGPGAGRPDLPLPPEKLPIRRAGNWRKKWRYLGAFSDELMLCAARVQVGPIGQTFWAVWDREERVLHERTRVNAPGLARGEVWTELAEGEHAGRIDWAPEHGGTLVRIEADARRSDSEHLRAFLRTGAGEWVECVCPTGEADNYVWTRKRAVSVHCDVRIGERRITCEARGIEDESCGYHPHHTVWDWSAGVGRTADGRDVAWNLVNGINDPPQRSERAIWVDGEPQRARAGELRRPRGDRGRRRAAWLQRRGRAQQGRGQAVGEVQLPPALRHLQWLAPRRARAGRGLRRHGAPRRPLVGADPADGLKPLPPIAKSTRRRAGGRLHG